MRDQKRPTLFKDIAFSGGGRILVDQGQESESQFIFPAFKFLSSKHARALLDSGNVRLATIREFRDPGQYKGTLLDIREGQVTLASRYTYYEGLAKDANGLLRLFFPPNSRVKVTNSMWSEDFDCSDVHIYCATQFLFSDSLEWAIGEKKDSCVLLTNVDLFLQRVSDALDDLLFVGVGECFYSGRNIGETDPGPDSFVNHLLSDARRIALVKPKEYACQRELRAVWQRTDGASEFEAIILDVPSVRELCIPVDFSNVGSELLLSPNPDVTLGMRLVRKPPGEPAEYLLQEPLELLSPVLYRSHPKERWLLGCCYAGEDPPSLKNPDVFSGGHIKGADHWVVLSNIGPIMCCVYLDQIERLEVFHVQRDA